MSDGQRSLAVGRQGKQNGLGKAGGQSWDLLDAVQVVVLVASLDGRHDGWVSMDLQCDALPLSSSQATLLSAQNLLMRVIIFTMVGSAHKSLKLQGQCNCVRVPLGKIEQMLYQIKTKWLLNPLECKGIYIVLSVKVPRLKKNNWDRLINRLEANCYGYWLGHLGTGVTINNIPSSSDYDEEGNKNDGGFHFGDGLGWSEKINRNFVNNNNWTYLQWDIFCLQEDFNPALFSVCYGFALPWFFLGGNLFLSFPYYWLGDVVCS